MNWFKERYRKASDIKPGDTLITTWDEWRVRKVTQYDSGLVTVECTGYSFNAGRDEQYKVRRN